MAIAPPVFTHTSQQGTTYYLHRRTDTRGVERYVFAREIGAGALAELPDAYAVVETLNGTVSLARVQPRVILEQEEQLVVAAVNLIPGHAVEVRKATIMVLEGAHAVDVLGRVHTHGGRFSPIVRFTLIDKEKRVFDVCRMTYRGDGGWSRPLRRGPLAELVATTVPHLSEDSFFELV